MARIRPSLRTSDSVLKEIQLIYRNINVLKSLPSLINVSWT